MDGPSLSTTGSTVRHPLAAPAALGVALSLLCGAVPAAGSTERPDDPRHAPWSGTAPDRSAPADQERRSEGDPATTPGTVDDVSEDATGPGPLAAASEDPPARQQPVPGRVLVQFDAGAGPAERAVLLAGVEGTVVDDVPGTGALVVDIGDQDPTAVATQLAGEDGVAVAQPDHVRSAAIWSDDPSVSVTWRSLDLVRLPRAWDESLGEGTVVAVLDTGVYREHEDLAGGVLPGWDFVNGDDDPSDDNGHGTFVAGVLAATGDNGLGAVGAAPQAEVLPVKVLDAQGHGSDSVVAEGIAYAVQQGVDVINLSLSGVEESPVLLEAVRRAVSAGVVVVAAAGNDPTGGPQYPAAYADDVPGLLSVSATDEDGALTRFSSWDDSVSVSAPGQELVGPVISGVDKYALGDGTSGAAPLVSGAAALLRAQQPTWTPAQVQERLLAATRDAGPRGVDPYYGRGVLDAAAALGAARAVPLDRGPSDGGTTHHPADAVPLVPGPDGAARVRGVMDGEGDMDWYRYDAPRAASYAISVIPWRPQVPDLVVLDATGNVVAEGEPLWSPSPYPPLWEKGAVVQGAGPWWIGVRSTAVERDYVYQEDSTYRLFVGALVPQPHERPVELGDPAVLDPGRHGSSTALADVTGDGRPDVIAWRGEGYDDSVVGFYPSTSSSEFGPYRSVVTLGRRPSYMGKPVVVPADIDGDGVAELVVVRHSDFDRLGLVWTVDGTSEEPQSRTVLRDPSTGSRWGGAVGADVDADGDDDVVVSTTSGVLLLEATPEGLVSREVPGWGTTDPPALAVVDVDADSDLDVAGAGAGVLLQGQDGSFTTAPAVPALSASERVVVEDVTRDGRADLVASDGSTITIAAARAGGGFSEPVAALTTHQVDDMVVADFDGDGLPDVVAVYGGSIHLALQRGDGTFMSDQYVGGVWVWGDYARPLFVDRDADGDLDVLVSTYYGGLHAAEQLEPVVVEPTPGWVWDASVDPHTAGMGVRPTVAVTFSNELVPASVDARTVRLVEGSTGADVPVVRNYSGKDLTVTPTADLLPGHHYTLLVSGLMDTTGAVMTEPYRTWFTVAADGDRFTPVDPYRLMDTRWVDPEDPVQPEPVHPGEAITLDLSQDVPWDATAVVLNVASTQADHVGNVRVYPTGSAQVPRVANLNVVPGVDQSNTVTVALNAWRSVKLLTEGMSTHLVADLAGYYTPGGATGFRPMTPKRILDLRDGTGARRGLLPAGRFVDVQVAGVNGVPADASAVVFNLAATQVTGRTHVRVYPTPADSEDQTPPDIANLNVDRGRDQANLVTVRVGEGGKVRLYTHSAALALVADVAGYYTATGDHGFVPVDPTRIADSRTGLGFPAGHLRAGTTTDLTVAGAGPIPADAVAAVLNVAATQVRGQTHVRAFPTTVPASLPDVSTLNLIPGRDESNHAFLRVGDRGRVSFHPWSSDVQLVVDAFGYFRR